MKEKRPCPLCDRLDTTNSGICRWCTKNINVYENQCLEENVDRDYQPIPWDGKPAPGWKPTNEVAF